MRRALEIFVLLLLAAMIATPVAAAEDPEEDDRIVIRTLHGCPEIKVLGGSGQAVRWLERSTRGFLGVEPSPLTPELRRHFGAPEDAGVLVARIVEDSAAVRAGLAVGDVITSIDGEPVTSPHGLGRAVRQKDGGAEVEIEYWRDRQRYTSAVTLGEHERCGFDIGNLPLLELENLGEHGFAISQEALDKLRAVNWEEALHSLRDIDWEKHLENFRALDVERMEERMQRVRERLERLEESLEREHRRLERLEERRERTKDDGGV